MRKAISILYISCMSQFLLDNIFAFVPPLIRIIYAAYLFLKKSTIVLSKKYYRFGENGGTFYRKWRYVLLKTEVGFS